MTRKTKAPAPDTVRTRRVPGRQPGARCGLAAGRNTSAASQRRRQLDTHYRAKFRAGRSGRRPGTGR